MSKQSKPSRAVIYIRLSDTTDDAAGALSLADQDGQCRQRGDALDWGVAEVKCENDLTGSGKRSQASAYKQRKVVHPDGRITYEDKRPVWREVLAGLSTGKWDGLIVLDLDRAIRRMRSAQDVIDVNRATGYPIESATGSLRIYGPEDYDQATITAWAASKSSADTARRVKAARERQRKAGTYGGGIRPYGFRTTDTPGVLAEVPNEIKVLDDMVSDLNGGRTLWAMSHELNERQVLTVKGGPWTPESVRSVILRERTGDVVSDHAAWEAAVAILRNPARRVGPGSKAAHLLSGILRCGVCGGPLSVQRCRGAYLCRRGGHVRIAQARTDAEVVATIVTRLAQPDAVKLLAKPDGSGADVAALVKEAGKLRQRKKLLAARNAAGEIDDDEWEAMRAVVKDKLAAIDRKIGAAAEHTADARTAALAGREDAAALWQRLDLEGKRGVIRSLVDISVNRQGRGVRPPGWQRAESYSWFNPERIAIRWRGEPVSSGEPAHIEVAAAV
jgi:DNA invertase Pin-like site-specific DNA recombinase